MKGKEEGRKMKKMGQSKHEIRNDNITQMHGRGNEWRRGEESPSNFLTAKLR
jgi:hypothetical protein